MKYLFLLLTVLPLFSFTSCEKDSDRRERSIMFYSDAIEGDPSYNLLYIDDVLAGTLSMTIDPVCGDAGVVYYAMSPHSEVDVEIRNSDGEAKYFGTISLKDWSSGIGVRLTGSQEGNVIVVHGTSSDKCTRVYLDWDY